MEIIALDTDPAAAPLIISIAHKDPFDELLLVQAQQSGARLLTPEVLSSSAPKFGAPDFRLQCLSFTC